MIQQVRKGVLVSSLRLAIGIAVCAAAVATARAADPQLEFLTSDGYFKQRPAWSPDGKLLAFARHRGAKITLFLIATDGSQERPLTGKNEPEYDAVFSPNGKRLAFAYDKTSPNQGDIEVYTIGVDGKGMQPLAVTEGKLSHEESPAWSRDGKHVAYTSTRDGNQEIYVVDVDGGNRRRLTSDNAIDAHPTFAPDGKRIVFATNRWGDLELAAVELSSGAVTRLTSSPGLDDYPAFSPDGKQLAFTSNRDRNLEIYLAEADGSNPHNATRHRAIDNFPTFAPDGRLTFVTNRAGGFDICVMRVK